MSIDHSRSDAAEPESELPPARTTRQRVAPFLRFVRRRLLHAIIVLFIVSVGTSLLVELVPGDPAAAILGENATPESLALARERLGIDKPPAERYFDWVGNAIQGDLGTSVRTSERVTDAIKQRFPVTLQLTIMAQALALLVCFPLATLMATRAGKRVDRVAEGGLSAIIAAPSFVVGPLLMYFIGVKWGWLPIVGWSPISNGIVENMRRAILPALTIALLEMATFTRILRGDLLTTFQEDYILAARAKGIGSRRVLITHAMRPSMFTLVTLGGLSFARLLGGTVIVESMFTLPGLGRLVIDAVKFGDVTMVQGVVLLIATAYLIINMLVDMAYGWLDPRVRDEGSR